MMRNWQTMMLALALAVFTWFLVTGREVVETWVEVPMVMTNPPEGMIIEDGLVEKLQIRLRGPKGLVDNIDTQRYSYAVDLGLLKIGKQVVEIESAKLGLPATFEIIEVKPNRLNLMVDRRATKTIAIQAAWSGDLPADWKLTEVVASPDMVEIRGPETKLRKIKNARVVLEEDFADEVPRNWVENVAIELPEEIEASPGQVRVEAFFGPKTREIWVKLPLTVIEPDKYTVKVDQDFVRLLIDGPIYLFRNDDFRKDMAVNLVLPEQMVAGSFDLDYEVVLPEYCRVVKRNPETIATTLKKKK